MAFEFTIRVSNEYKKFRNNWRKYAGLIKELGKEFFRDNLVVVYVFGSTVRGDYRILSDIDVAVVLKENVDEFQRAKFRSLVRKKLGRLNPFEIHIITNDEWKNWYSKFIKGEFVEF